MVNGENGMLIEIDDVAGLARAINAVLEDAALCARIVTGGRKSYTEKFTRAVFIRESLAFYERVLREQGRGGC